MKKNFSLFLHIFKELVALAAIIVFCGVALFMFMVISSYFKGVGL